MDKEQQIRLDEEEYLRLQEKDPIKHELRARHTKLGESNDYLVQMKKSRILPIKMIRMKTSLFACLSII